MPEHLHRAVGDFGRHCGSGRRPSAAGRAGPGSVNGNLLCLHVGNPVNMPVQAPVTVRGDWEKLLPEMAQARAVVEIPGLPDALSAAAAIDWSIEGTPIGDRPKTEECPEGLAPNTMARIRAGIDRFWPAPDGRADAGQGALFGDVLAGGRATPLLVPTGGTWRAGAGRTMSSGTGSCSSPGSGPCPCPAG